MQYQWRAEITASQLDMLFLSNFGRRNPSPVVDLIKEKYDLDFDDALTEPAMQELAALLLMTYKPKWDKLGEVYDIEYDPIHNYLDEWEDESEGSHSRTGLDVGTRNDSNSINFSTSRTRTDNLMETLNRDVDKTGTRTDNLQELETRDLSTESTRTDDLEQETSYGSTSTRTDNLNELETRNLAGSSNRTDNLLETKNYGGTSTRTDNTTQTDSGSSGSKEHQVYAFNSNQYRNADKDIFTGEGSNTRNNTGTVGTVNGGTDTTSDTGTQMTATTDSGTVTTANTGTQAEAKSGSDTVANSGTQTTATDEDGTVTVSNTGTQTTGATEDETTTVANTGTQTTAGQDSTTGTNSRATRDEQSESGTDSRDRSGRHFGNIGNLTSQAQIREEIELWKWNYVNNILDDAKNFLCLETYLNY